MSVLVAVLACLAGGVGAVLRYGVDSAVTRRTGGRLPWGTFVVNVSGALVLGTLTGATPAVLPSAAATVVAAGLLGGYTTFSTASVQTADLFTHGRPGAAWANLLGTLGVSVVAAGVGLVLGRMLGTR